KGHLSGFILDVWEKEPLFSDTVAKKAHLATPHIAGYSLQAKRKATEMIADALHRFFNLKPPASAQNKMHHLLFPESPRSLREVLEVIHPAFQYDRQLRALTGMPPSEKASGFHAIRHHSGLRNEFSQIVVEKEITDTFPVLTSLGITNG
ncbi:hypothetical protein QLX67_12465, partial [Balneolaceae bacterium ANBcel3]|nr:hypothetical protein [Balneolaceae bacterium ANBcel3]